MSVAVISPPKTYSWVELLEPAAELARSIGGTDFVPKSLRTSPAAIAAAILYGAEVGLGPMQSLARIAIVDGRPCLYAEAQRALILAAGHDLWIEESTVTRCTIAGQRRGSDQTSRVTWTLDDARRANLAGRQNWRTYPRQMLLARASAELARTVFADAIGGLAAAEEMEDPDPGPITDGAPSSEPEPQTRQRKPRATISAPLEPEPAPPVELPGDEDAEPTAPIDEPTRRFLHARKRALGIEDADLKMLIKQVTGQESTTKIQRNQLDDLLALMESAHLAVLAPTDPEQLEEPSPFQAPPGALEEAQAMIDIGRPHEDRG